MGNSMRNSKFHTTNMNLLFIMFCKVSLLLELSNVLPCSHKKCKLILFEFYMTDQHKILDHCKIEGKY